MDPDAKAADARPTVGSGVVLDGFEEEVEEEAVTARGYGGRFPRSSELPPIGV